MRTPPTGAWISQIDTARSSAELLRVLRDYLAALSPEDLSHLPGNCRPESLARAADIQEWAVVLAQADLKASGSDGAGGPLHQAAVVFAAAGTKLPKVNE